jgi:hypothetical protein
VHHVIDMNTIQSIGTVGGLIVSFAVALNRHGIAKHIKRVFGSFHKTVELVKENEELTERLASAEQRNLDWQKELENLDTLRIAMSAQLDRFRLEIEDLRKRMSAKDDLLHLLQYDRDSMVFFSRYLVGQLHANNLSPDYPAPALRSVVAVPVPDSFTPYPIISHDDP